MFDPINGNLEAKKRIEMKITRRIFLGGVAACALSNNANSANQVIPSGWHTLLLGAGGLITGLDIAPDGTMVCRTDEYGCYRWSGTTATVTNPSDKWIQLVTPASMPASSKYGVPLSCYECVIAHSQTSRLAMIVGNSSGAANWAVYISNDYGATWTNSGLFMLNADGNSSTLQKGASGKILFDPNNADVVYVGMPKSSGNNYGVYRSIDGGVTFNPITSIAAPTLDPGCTAMCFDIHYGTTTVSGQLRTKRLLIPVGGRGLWETLDGGQTFTEVGNASLTTVSIHQAQMDYDGVYYCNNNAGTTNGYIWRYSGPGGTWVQLDAQAGWKRGGGWLRNLGSGWLGNSGLLIVDPRNGHQGFVSASGPNGLGAGFTSHNANAADASTIKWDGETGGEVPSLVAPSYDIAWLNHGIQGLNAFIGAANAIIDQNGIEWWCGNQAFWYFSSIPDYGVSAVTTSNAVARGIEQTVTTNVCKPPGATYPILGCQDMGILTGGFTQYPTDYYRSGARMDCYSLDWAANDPSFMVAKVDFEYQGSSGAISAYSANYGLTGTWVPYATQPDTMWSLPASFGGQIVAVDHDHHICIGTGFASALQPVYTANATSPSCTWHFCSGLPTWKYMHGSFNSLSKPFAVDRVNIGTVYAVAVDDSSPVVASKIYRSTDSGATWTQVSTHQIGAGGNFTNVFLYTVPGYAGHLWLASSGTSGWGNGLWRSTDGGSTWTTIKPPSQYLVVALMAFGAPATTGAYPTLYVAFTYGYQRGSQWYKSIDEGATWTSFDVNLPVTCALNGVSNFSADWDTYGRLYFGTYGAGFAYYSP